MLHGAGIFIIIYLHLPQKLASFVGKYSSTMEHLGINDKFKVLFLYCFGVYYIR